MFTNKAPLFHSLFFLAGMFLFQVPSYPQRGLGYIQLSQEYLKNGEYVRALETLNFAIQTSPSAYELYYLRGYAKYCLDDYIGAERDYSRSIELFPYQPDIYIGRAFARSLQNNSSGALDDLTHAAEMDSTNAVIWFNMARIKLTLKKYYACLNDCNRAIRLNLKDENVYILRGSADAGLQRYDKAITDFRKAAGINPSNIFSYIQLVSVLIDLGKIDSALICANRAIEIDSLSIYALFDHSLVLIKMKDLKNALSDLNKVIRLSPYNSYAYFNRAIIYADSGRKEDAVRDFSIVIKLNPKNIICYYYRGQLRAELKDYKDALDDFDKTIELLPEYADAYYGRYQVKIKLNDRKSAQDDYRKAMDITRKNKLSPDSLTSEKKNYMQSLIKLSGDFEEMNTMNSKFQNQYIDIQLMPVFNIFLGKAGFDLVYLYDTYPKEHYFTDIITLTSHDELISDSLCNATIAFRSKMIDSCVDLTESYYKRAISYSGLRKYNLAFADYDSTLNHDPDYVLAYFSRANSRYELIQLINSIDNYQNQITIGKSNSPIREQINTGKPEHTYDTVIFDYTRAISLDTGFYFAYYNRGVVYLKMGEYHKANDDFTKAIALRTRFAEAFYNRGLIRILLSDNENGCEDLSHAGELGITDAYKVMKRYCYK